MSDASGDHGSFPGLGEDARFATLVGDWAGEEQVSGSHWTVAGKATTTISARLEIGGRYLLQHFRQFRDGVESFSGLNLFGRDRADGGIKYYGFDAAGFLPPSPATGEWDGDRLVLLRTSPRGAQRLVFELDGENTYRLHIAFQPPGGEDWQDVTRGIFHRTGRTPATSE